ncbi:telomere-associated protein RIF1-like isoform X2 [Ostrea edulis]|uniref:telomere-associated protein RIF1-like isoform X2 n=1 Tax=Ostrea edulis TaxID=37623 RepID=UPI0024AF4F83|nr:telomere-associated protein RIF1-like isoform X2 [Ostrea edulis]
MEDDINVATLLETLEVKSKEGKDGVYLQLANQLKEYSVSLVSLDVAKNSKKLCDLLKEDLQNNHLDPNGLQILGFCLHDREAVGNLSADFCQGILSFLCDCVEKTEDKNVCAKCLWCLHQQNIAKDIVSQQVESILTVVEQGIQRWKMQSSMVEHEASQVIYRLLKDYRREMESHALRWGKLLLPLMAHRAIKIHERALEVVKAEFSAVLIHQRELSQALIPEFKLRVGSDLKWFFTCQEEIHALECWEIYVQICGKELHHGSFINMLLPIMELAFKGSNEVKVRAFQAWQVLIDNFATNHDILTCPKRIKLVMQVLKSNNAKTEAVAMAKLDVWWHFIWLLGSKASASFEQVCLPLIQFCVGGSKGGGGLGTPRTLTNGTSPRTPRMNLSGGNSIGTAYLKIPSLQLKGCEVLAHFLGGLTDDVDVPKHSFSLDPLTYEIITGPAFFVKQSGVFVQYACELICDLGSQIPEGLLLRIWFSLIAHMKNGLDSGTRGEMKDTVTTFLTQFQILVLSQTLTPKIILKLFNAVCCIPSKALISTAYNVNCGEKLHGTPALFLLQLLLTPNLLKDCSSLESYTALYSKLVNIGIGGTGSLEFAQSVLHLLDISAEFVGSPELLWRLWSTVVNPLHQLVQKTNEVNQGDALEHNFSCLYAVLLFPIKHQLPAKMPQMTVKTLQKTWSEIYQTFARLSALVTNAEANVCCEDLCHQINKCLKDAHSMSLHELDFLSQTCQTMLGAFDFSSLGASCTFSISSMHASPAKWAKRKQKPMENLHSCVVLIQKLLETLNICIKSADKKGTSASVSPQGPANGLVDCLCSIFSHISSSNVLGAVIGHLSQPIGDLYQESIRKTCAKLFSNTFMQKLEKLWHDICTSLQTRHSGMYDSEFLSKLSPLLEATFVHPRRAIKNQTSLLWSGTFTSASHLVYPVTLRPILAKVKEKSTIILPGWVSIPVTVVEETPASQMSQADSQAPEPHLPGMPSPRKIHGSLLNKTVSPNPKKSPARPAEKVTRSPVAVRKNLSVNELQKEDFVVIKSPLRKKRILTEHQKEVLKEKRVIPTMYNTLDNSQDASLMFGADSQFGSDTQSEPLTPTVDSVIVIDSSFSQHLSQKKDKSIKRAARKSSSEASDKEDSQNSQKEGAGSRRRRSVRFKDTVEEAFKVPVEKHAEKGPEENGAEKTPSQEEFEAAWDQTLSKMVDEVEKNSIDHFSVIKCTMSSSQQQGKSSGENTTTGSEDAPPLSNTQTKLADNVLINETSNKANSVGSDEKETGSSKSSLFSSGDGYVAPQNVMEAVEIECLTYKSTSSSGEDKAEGKAETKEKEEKRTSQSLQTWTSQLNQTSPRKVNSSVKKLSQESSESSPARASRRFASPAKRGRGKNLENYSKGFHKIDEWLIKSPEKSSQESEISSQGSDKLSGTSSSESQAVEVTVVEETQSPKSMRMRVSPNSQPIQETPPPPTNKEAVKFGNTRGSTRKLFTKGTDAPSLDQCEDSNIIPGSPESTSSSLFIGVGTPVLKLKRLTNKEIKHFSPHKKDVNILHEERRPQSSAVEVDSQSSNHEHDDFSDVLPLDAIPLSSSQGFETQDKEKERVDQLGDKLMTSTENLFSQNENLSQENSVYDPQLQSTFKPNCEGKDVLGTENLILSQHSDKSSISEKESQLEEAKPEESAPFYDPKLESTLPQDTPRRGRKRKQEAPKKLSPESSRPKRTRQSKIDNVKTPRGKVREVKKGSSKGKTAEKKQKDGVNPGQKTDRGEDFFPVDSQQHGEENSKVKMIVEITNQTSISDNMDTEKDNDVTCDERQLDSEGFFLEKTEEKIPEAASCQKLDESHQKLDEVCQKSDESSQESDESSQKLDESSQKSDESSQKSDESGQKSDESSQKSDESSQKLSEKKKSECLGTITAEEKGEKTPSSRSIGDVPLRKSTTKKKIEVAKKRSQKKGKSDSDEQVTSDCSEDDLPLAQTIKQSAKSKGKLENKMDAINLKLGSVTDACEENEAKILNDSDDKIPLNNLCSSNEDLEKTDGVKENIEDDMEEEKLITSVDGNDKESVSEERDSVTDGSAKKKSKKRILPAKNSPLSNRLRSSQGTLRSGKPTRRSLSPRQSPKSISVKKPTRRSLSPRQSPKSLSLKKTLKRKSLDASLLSVVIEDSEEPEGKHLKDPQQDDTNEVSEVELSEKTGGKESETAEDIDMLNDPKRVMLDETPKKIPEMGSDGGQFGIFERHTDSKLVIVPRKFEKRGIARRSILKPSSPRSNLKNSPLKTATTFHPIKLGQIYAPSASPSASILKRRRLSGEIATNSPSPPGKKKQRRVSFANTVTFSPLSSASSSPVTKTDFNSKSCLFTESSPAIVTSSEMSQTGTQESVTISRSGFYYSDWDPGVCYSQ